MRLFKVTAKKEHRCQGEYYIMVVRAEDEGDAFKKAQCYFKTKPDGFSFSVDNEIDLTNKSVAEVYYDYWEK